MQNRNKTTFSHDVSDLVTFAQLLPRGALVEFDCLLIVSTDSLAVFVKITEVAESYCVTLVGGFLIPLSGDGIVPCKAAPLVDELASATAPAADHAGLRKTPHLNLSELAARVCRMLRRAWAQVQTTLTIIGLHLLTRSRSSTATVLGLRCLIPQYPNRKASEASIENSRSLLLGFRNDGSFDERISKRPAEVFFGAVAIASYAAARRPRDHGVVVD